MRLAATLFVLLFIHVPIFASVFPRFYDRDQSVIDFRENGTEKNFLKIEYEEMRTLLYVEILYDQYLNQNGSFSKEGVVVGKSIDDGLILSKYLANAPDHVKRAVAEKLFIYAIEQNNVSAARHFLGKNPSTSIGSLVCAAIENLAYVEVADRLTDKEAFEGRQFSMTAILPFIVDHSLQNQTCEGVDENGQDVRTPIHQILASAGQETYAEYAQLLNARRTQSSQPIRVISEAFTKPKTQIHCSRSNLEWYFRDVILKLRQSGVGGQYFLYVNSPNCSVQGIAKYTKDGFEFHLNAGIPLAPRSLLKFTNLEEITKQIESVR